MDSVTTNYNYHTHIDNNGTNQLSDYVSTIPGGCYESPVYHSHNNCTSYACGCSLSTFVSNNTNTCPFCGKVSNTYFYKCADGHITECLKDACKCGMWFKQEVGDACRYKYYACGKTTSDIDGYILSCGKTEETIDSFTIQFN